VAAPVFSFVGLERGPPSRFVIPAFRHSRRFYPGPV